MDTSHFGVTPTTLCSAVLSAWSALQMSGGSGCVRSIARLKSLKPEAVAQAMLAGAPALLLYYEGFSTTDQSSHGQKEEDVLTFHIVAVSAQLTTVRARQDGGDRDPDTAILPGVEDLQDWGRYLAMRALVTAGAKNVKTVRGVQAHAIEAEHFTALVTITARRTVDIYDDDSANLLQELGLCHDPTEGYDDPTLWFTGGPPAETPVSDWPVTTDGGVTDL